MEGIIGKESESILRFFILLENIQVKMDQLMEGNQSDLFLCFTTRENKNCRSQ